MEAPNGNNKYHLGIHASIVFQLGESLIRNPVQALTELMKNAYDADSPYVTVTIETAKKNNVEPSCYKGAQGYIIVQDGGSGMNMGDIRNGWLTISNSLKREMKTQGKKTANLERTPLGDKGLGRLGAQRLGHNLEIFTKIANEPFEYHVAFSWKEFQNKNSLNDVEIYVKKIHPTREKGTTLLISDLKEPNFFKDRVELQKELSRMLSPYNEINEFNVVVNLEGTKLDIASFKEGILNAAEVSYKIDFDGETLTIKGKTRTDFFRPPGKKSKELFRQLVEEDGGNNFFEFLSQQEKAKTHSLKRSKEEGWFIEYELIKPFIDIDSLELIEHGYGEKPTKANPGTFQGGIDSFDIGKEGAGQQSVFDKASEYKEYIKDLSGIRVYRDGFGVRVDKDWLGLGKQWTSGRSYYGLRVENTLGYILLSAENNKNLEETTDREGFKITPYYKNFFEMLQLFVRFSGEIQAFLRRQWIIFSDLYQEKLAKIDSRTTPEELSGIISRSLSKADSYHTHTESVKILLNKEILDAHQVITDVTGNLQDSTGGIEKLKASLEKVKKYIDSANSSLDEIDTYLKEIQELEAKEKVINNQVRNLRDQLEQLVETAGLGLTAEALSHEIQVIADGLADRSGKIHAYLKSQTRRDPKVLSFIEYVNTATAALRKEMSHLAPSLKFVREKREKIEMFPFCREMAFFYYDRLKNNHIDVHVTPKNTENFIVYVNRGKLVQIFDNLFLNSEYWVREDIRTGDIKSGKINITIDKPFVKFFDNGRGVDPTVETSLFEPFVTAKGKGKGRGLGLFIVKQFLDAEGCSISLLSTRNSLNRLGIFEINFTGGLYDR
jgi:signal transduction histidine kinase